MIILQLNGITKYYGAEPILSNIKLEVQSKDRIALVGRNGAGKSTLLKIIAEQLSYDSGEIIKPKGVSIDYMGQDTVLESTLSIWEEMMTVFAPLKKMEKELRTLETKMGDPDIFNDSVQYEKLTKEYDQLQVTFKDLGGYQYEADTRSILHGFRFSNFDYSTPISSLSGGQKTRLALAKLLLTKPDLLILDEPTNHLDIETLAWLEQFLQGYEGAILIVSHDRYFLDKVVNQVYEVTKKTTVKYTGNYSKYLVQKAERYEKELRQYEKQQDEVAKLNDFIQRNIARASTTKRAQSRRKQLDRIELINRPNEGEKSASFSFEIERQSGNEVLNLENVSIGYDEHKYVVQEANLRIKKGESLALVGPNGVGKSTLLKGIVDKLSFKTGTISFGSNVMVGYYDQEQANLTSNKTVLNELWDDYPSKPEKEIRTALGNFLFSGDDVLKIVSTLSGGEKARLALSKLMLQKANFLILDEPTNHLDLDSKQVLENALIDYPGTLLFVSHDRYFINRIANKIAELSPEGVEEFLGDYDYYVEKKAEIEEIKELENIKANEERTVKVDKQSYKQDKEQKKLMRQRTRRIEEIETEVNKLEAAQAENEELLCDPEIYQNHEEVSRLNGENEKISSQLSTLMEEWEELQLLLEE
ncbi:ABC-F family ATP-binding cassette domain-containing protein [Priestia megaterium]|uniref:Heme ABC exporter, ATP-binding protein CcmA n=1 Tax=Priestia megaterium (strain ATCC 14581 / DSM 32 / CCUG 1817 / JCM 2506 / NBRC 15308 / NCIMB 9376 / NCTC 10342 / NRRL B-14308 / VKM B-512 / Ford 19) TaxID=1348623 RepID=A0A0B6AR74_PRIM2|nr:ABC-F family ATP-binding cassette domain-containing protein [Priestia megaterium]AJI23168.1 heme ABC exporter, ATP-binding protein CcmA [Priestia megaterium NBRC 15308 = ATCC 14581]KFN08693.1 heme ABC exporter, ATP-binding protein CcmA [Priestia megaterium]KGJ85776.1 multidrug ABC transporter ATP-binding protein [Priestia megaterium NBRC 15308 = ATCC 14581]MBU8757568.1 ABC-F family ATP-binding cassette domain-containing protein [Priestia megaterium]MDH3183952.1 ABC-F family ATP-binding cass